MTVRWPDLTPWMAPAALALVALVFVPLLPGLVWALGPSFDLDVWQTLLADAQWPRALRATLVSAVLGTVLACALAAGVVTLTYPSARWQRLQQRLPLLLAMPHAAFAVGLFFLLAPSGWLARGVAQALSWSSPPDWVSVQDPLGLSLALALAIKESWFLLWVLAGVLGEQTVQRQLVVARSLGYSRLQAWRHVLWPQLLPRLGWPVAAALAYSVSVVDMALILGPGTPPTLAVLAWHWLTDPDPARQAQGGAAALVLLLLFAALSVVVYGLWRALQSGCRYPGGQRAAMRAAPQSTPAWPSGSSSGGLSIWLRDWRSSWRTSWRTSVLPASVVSMGYAVLAVLLLWSLAETWFFPALWPSQLSLAAWQAADWAPFWTTFWLAGLTSLIGLPLILLWLEWGPQRLNALLYLPLMLPALPLVAAQYATLLHLRLDAMALALVWSHLLWVLPYMLLTLVGAYRGFDARLLTSARALGCTRLQACLRVKWPLLLRPLLGAWAVGFAVSVAQYLPTLFAGGGRFATVTTEAVALSAGGSRQVLAVQALLQIALPLAAFALAAWLVRAATRQRLGWR